jgi:hypothetical protein
MDIPLDSHLTTASRSTTITMLTLNIVFASLLVAFALPLAYRWYCQRPLQKIDGPKSPSLIYGNPWLLVASTFL